MVYFDAVFNNTNLSPIEQDESIIQFYRNVATQANPATKADNKMEPNGRAMSKFMTMFNGQGRGAELSSAKDRRQMAQQAVALHAVSIRLACSAFGISETCYRYQVKLSDDNALIAEQLIELTEENSDWGFQSVHGMNTCMK